MMLKAINFSKFAAKCFLIIFVLLVCIELTYRVYSFGFVDTFSYRRSSSWLRIAYSDIVKPSNIPGLSYELKGDSSLYNREKMIFTNSFGFRDKEFTKIKPADKFRIAVVGSSFTFGLGVEQDEIYTRFLERKLNNGGIESKYEVMNFSLSGYTSMDMLLTLENKLLQFKPDLIIFSLTGVTMKWDFKLNIMPRTYSDLEVWLYVLKPRSLIVTKIHALKFLVSNTSGFLRDFFKELQHVPMHSFADTDRANENLELIVGRLANLQAREKIPILISRINFIPSPFDQKLKEESLKHKINLLYMPTSENKKSIKALEAEGLMKHYHPTPLGHEVIADFLYNELKNKGYLK